MSCCDEFGSCTLRPGCRACREPAITPSLARAANERIRKLEAKKTALHLRVLDWPGNMLHRLGRWVDRTNLGRLLCLSFGAVIAGGMAVSFLVGWVK